MLSGQREASGSSPLLSQYRLRACEMATAIVVKRTDDNQTLAKVNRAQVHSDGLRCFLLLANSAEKRDQAEAEAVHGQRRTDPCQRCAIKRLCCPKRSQARPLFRQRNPRIELFNGR